MRITSIDTSNTQAVKEKAVLDTGSPLTLIPLKLILDKLSLKYSGDSEVVNLEGRPVDAYPYDVNLKVGDCYLQGQVAGLFHSK
ncbi:MAG: hypothetical protein WA902_07585 [Thermosynechococcaceae cyanobacterium]